MISFQPTEEEIEFTSVAEKIAKEKIRPAAHVSENERKIDAAIIDEIAELGFLSLELPEDWDGLELPLISQVQIMSALSSGDLGIVQGLPGLGDVASFIRKKPEQAVSKLEQAEHDAWSTAAFLDITNRDAPWANQLVVNTRADGYVLHGVSQPVRLACFADYILVAARDADGVPVVLWLDEPAVWRVKEGDVRLGLLASGVGRLSFDQAFVGKDQVLASGEKAADWIANARTRIYVLQAAKEVGLMQAALEYTTAYTAERKAFGQEIAKFQGVSFRVAKMAIETRIANHLVWRAAVKADRMDDDAQKWAMQALYRAHRSVRYVTDSAVQMLGGHGYVQEYPVEKWMRDAQAQTMLYGREQMLLNQYGEQILIGAKEGATP
ncbi:MAG TPA: acyl-CoA dehydrogenase family protein [Bacillota bacterium]|nr:acyl-CoA dehydrogenase family protein [Bacillota bacterium]